MALLRLPGSGHLDPIPGSALVGIRGWSCARMLNSHRATAWGSGEWALPAVDSVQAPKALRLALAGLR